MFQDISNYLPLEKELIDKDLKKEDFPQKGLFRKIFSLEKNSTPIWIDEERIFYDFIVQNSLIEKLENNIKYEKEWRKNNIRKKLSKYKDIEKRWKMIETVKEECREIFYMRIKIAFEFLLTSIVEWGNIRMLEFLMEKYEIYVALVKEIYVKEKDENVMKYMKCKGLDKQIKINKITTI